MENVVCFYFPDFCQWQSGLHPNQVDYINAHATSTPLGKSYGQTFSHCFPFNLSICISRMSICVMTCVSVVHAQISDSGDAVEAIAIKTVFSEHATSGALAFSSTKVNIKFQIRFTFWEGQEQCELALANWSRHCHSHCIRT